MKKLRNILILLCGLCLAAPLAGAQEATTDDSDNAVGINKSRTKKKRRGKIRVKRSRVDVTSYAGNEPWFPSWPPEAFDWNLGPIAGFKFTSTTSESGREDTSTTEFGLQGGLTGIPIVPSNPGFSVGASAGAAKGTLVTTTTADQIKLEDVSYTRIFGNLDFTVPVHFYRHRLIISRGKKNFDDDLESKIQSFGLTNDFGLLFKSWLSGHYTHRYLRVFEEKYEEQLMNEQDNWLHATMRFKLLSTMVDLGPGLVQNTEFGFVDDLHQELAKGQSTYFKAASSFRLFWKIGMDAGAKYVISADEEDLGNYAQVDLPEAGLNTPRSTAMPEDSVLANAVFGIPNLFGGFGLGWVYNLQILNLSKRDGRERITTKDNGFRVFFSAQF